MNVFFKEFRLSKIFLAVLMVMVLAFALTASAATGINQIGSSPSQLDPTAQGVANYGYDPMLPLILTFDVAVDDTTVLIGDIALNLVVDDVSTLQPITLLFSTDTMNPNVTGVDLMANEVIVVPTNGLLGNSIYTIQYEDQTLIEFKTKGTGGGGGQNAPRLCVGRIVDSTDIAGVANGTLFVPINQLFRYAFTNNIPATTVDNTDPTNVITHNNADSINMFKWIGTDPAPTRTSILGGANPDTLTPAFFDNANWMPVAISEMFGVNQQPLRQIVSIMPDGGLDTNSFYAILIDQTLESQGNQNNGNPPQSLQKAVFEFFKTGMGGV